MSLRQDVATPVDRRIDWVDAAKGMSILLVVVHHVIYFSEPYGLVPGPLSALNTALASLRMPLFFLASGLFAAAPLAAPWRTLLHKRVAFFGYLFVLWSVLQALVFWSLPSGVGPPDVPRTVVDLAWQVVLLPGPAMWFLYALALFSVLGKLVRRTPAWAQLGVSGVLCATVGAGLITFPNFEWTFMARYLFFFLLGVHARTLVQAVADRASLLTVLAGGAICGATAGAAVVLDVRSVFGVAFVLNVAAVTFGVLLAGYLSRFRVGRPLVVLGRNTLPVYLINVLVVAAVVAAVRGVRMPGVVGWVAPALLAVAVVGLTLLLERGLYTVGATWLFALPRPLAYRAVRRAAPVAPPSSDPDLTATGQHRLLTHDEPVLIGAGPLPGGAGPVPAGPATAPLFRRRPVPRRSAFWDTDDWNASARPTTVLRPVRD